MVKYLLMCVQNVEVWGMQAVYVTHLVVFIPLALEGRAVFLSVTHQHRNVLWHFVNVALRTVKLHFFPEWG